MRLLVIVRFIGLLVVSIAVNMIGALAWSAYYGEPEWKSFLIVIIGACVLGGLGFWQGQPQAIRTITRKEALVVVSVGWFIASLVGALPFYLSGVIPHFYDAFFETASGFTTTGASILTNVEALPKGMLFWRSYTHWLGGMGIVVLFVALFPFLGIAGKKMYQFEVPGIDTEGLRPKIQTSAFILWTIYIGLSGIETLLLVLAGMPLFDALCHTFGTMATGGFGTKNTSIAYYPNPMIHVIIIVFMVLAGMNFNLHYALWKRNFAQLLRDSEFKAYLLILTVSALSFASLLYVRNFYHSFLRAVLDSAFTVSSIMTTTGYVTADFETWPMVTKIWLILLMFVGGCGGSTGGGIKVARIVLLIRYAYWQLIGFYIPQRKSVLKLAHRPVNQAVIEDTLGFFFLYLAVYALGVLVIACYGYDWGTCISSVAACLNNIGPGFSLVGATGNYAFMAPVPKVFLSVYMIAGRLEVLAVLVLFVPDFWKR